METSRKSMSSNYPEGSMMGSGIYSSEITMELICDECEYVFETDVPTNDWGSVDTWVTCPKCTEEFSVYRERTDPEPDYDSMYKERDI
jgi:hypothetical protein